MQTPNRSTAADWPAIPIEGWADTAVTLHMFTQVVGKVRLERTPWTNHSWHVPLYVTARGLGTSPIPHGARVFSMDFDFLVHRLVIQTGDGARRDVALEPRTVKSFYEEVVATLRALDLPVTIHTTPSEVADATPFDQDTGHASYESGAVTRFWHALVQMDRVFKEFRSRFVGKCSPVHFFWGSFDMAVTRFSGRPAPPHPGGVPNFPDWVAREAYSHEVSSAGFWPGAPGVSGPVFYAYAYPQPDGFEAAAVEPDAAGWSEELGEFVLPYEAVATAESPDETLLAFLQGTYEAAADRADWPRELLERPRVPADPA